MPEVQTQLSARERMQAVLAQKKAARPVPLAPVHNQEVAAKPEATEEYSAKRDAELQEKMKTNPVFLALRDESLKGKNEEKFARLEALIDDLPGDTSDRLKAVKECFEFLQMVRRGLATGQIKATADQIHSDVSETLDSVHEKLGEFLKVIEPVHKAHDLIQKYHKEEETNEEGEVNKAKPLTERLIEALAAQKELKKQQEDHKQEATRLEGEIKELQATEKEQATAYSKSANGAFAFTRKLDTAGLARTWNDTKAEITAKQTRITELRNTPAVLENSVDFDPEMLLILDTSGPEFRQQATTAATTTIDVITTTEVRLDEAIEGLIGVQDKVTDLFKYGNEIDLYISTLQIAVDRCVNKNKLQKTVNDSAPADDGEKLERMEQEVEASRKQRYLSNLTGFQTSLGKAAKDVKKNMVAIGVLDENIRQAIEEVAEVRTNTIATVSEVVSTYLQSIIFESQANKVDMLSGVLTKLGEAAGTAQKGQIELLPAWAKKDNRALERRIASTNEITDMLIAARNSLMEEKAKSAVLNDIAGQAIDELQGIARDARAVGTTPVSDEQIEQAMKKMGLTDAPSVAPTQPGASTAKPSGLFPGF